MSNIIRFPLERRLGSVPTEIAGLPSARFIRIIRIDEAWREQQNEVCDTTPFQAIIEETT